MWSDDRFLDVCASSERVRDAWIRQRRRSRALAGASGVVLSCIGIWQLLASETNGALISLFAALVILLGNQHTTMEIRLLRLLGAKNSARLS